MRMLVEFALVEIQSSPFEMVKFLKVIWSEKKVSTPSVFRAGCYQRSFR